MQPPDDDEKTVPYGYRYPVRQSGPPSPGGLSMRRIAFIFVLAIIIAAAACGGHQYGFARQYEPLSDEEELYENAETVSYEELRRDTTAYRERLIGWFGVVTEARTDPATGETRAAMELRVHRKRHLCADHLENSCRVTVSEKTIGPFTTVIRLRPEDTEGKNRVYRGSLLKVYGSPDGEFDDQGGPIIRARYYRHWPRGTFVTTAAIGVMRR